MVKTRPSGAVWIALLVAALFFAGAPSASALDTIYWGNQGNNEIHFANLGGGAAKSLETGSAIVSEPDGLAFDIDGGRVYWGNHFEETISYAKLDDSGGGGQLATPGASTGEVEGLAIDPDRRKIYWAEREDNTIQYAKLDGSGGGSLSTGLATVDDPSGLAIDLTAGRVYWVNKTLTGSVSYANLDGSGGGDLASAPDFPFGPAIDKVGGRIYWSNNAGEIQFVGLAGGAIGTLSTAGATIGEIRGLAVDHSRGRVYWADLDESTISYANLDGSGGGGALAISGAGVTEPFGPAILDPSVRATPPPPPPGPAPAASQCVVPRLQGKKLKPAKKLIRKADCNVGKVKKRRGAAAKAGKVVGQKPKPGAVLPVGTKIRVVLGARRTS